MRNPGRNLEASHQKALFKWAEVYLIYPPKYGIDLDKRVALTQYLFAIPNGGSRNIIEAAHLKLQGVKGGVPDMFLCIPSKGRHGMFIELKRPNNFSITKQQREWLDKLDKAGYCTRLAAGWEKAQEMIVDYLDA